MFSKVLAAAWAIPTIIAYSVSIAPQTTECFYENMKKGQSLNVSYDLESTDDHEIDFHVLNADGRVVYTNINQQQGYHVLEAEKNGKYTFCFNNHMTKDATKIVSFHVHGMDRQYIELDPEKLAAKGQEKMESVDKEAEKLSTLIDGIRDHQQYAIVHGITHKQTAESTAERVKWWSLLQLGLLIFVTVFQIKYLKRFFHVKRSI